MKKRRKLKKRIVILFMILTILFSLSCPVYASSTDWDFKLVGVGDAVRYYGTDGKVITYFGKNVGNYNWEEYSANTPEVYLDVVNVNTICYLNTYVDGVHIEESKCVDFKQIGDNYYEGVVVRYLSPGEHKIEVLAYTGLGTDSTVKRVTVNVNIPYYSDEQIKDSLDKINAGTAKQNDYEFVIKPAHFVHQQTGSLNLKLDYLF